MNEPLRWLEDPTTPAKLEEILKTASAVPSMPPALESKLGAYAADLLARGAVAKGSATWIASKAALSFGSVATKTLLVASLIGAAGSTGYVVAGRHRARSVAEPTRQLTAVASQTARSGAVPSVGTIATLSDELTQPIALTAAKASAEPSAAGEVAKQAGKRVLEPDSVASSPPLSTVDALAEPSIAVEARVLEAARLALDTNPRDAYELAERHRRVYPNGQLSAEREFIAIDALLRMGRRPEAEQRAAPRLDGAPESLYSRRLRQLLAD